MRFPPRTEVVPIHKSIPKLYSESVALTCCTKNHCLPHCGSEPSEIVEFRTPGCEIGNNIIIALGLAQPRRDLLTVHNFPIKRRLRRRVHQKLICELGPQVNSFALLRVNSPEGSNPFCRKNPQISAASFRPPRLDLNRALRRE